MWAKVSNLHLCRLLVLVFLVLLPYRCEKVQNLAAHRNAFRVLASQLPTVINYVKILSLLVIFAIIQWITDSSLQKAVISILGFITQVPGFYKAWLQQRLGSPSRVDRLVKAKAELTKTVNTVIRGSLELTAKALAAYYAILIIYGIFQRRKDENE